MQPEGGVGHTVCTSLCILAVNVAGLIWEAVSFPPTLSAFVDFINYRTNQPLGFIRVVNIFCIC